MSFVKFSLAVGILGISSLFSWEDHPDRQDFLDRDRQFKESQKSTGCDKYDRSTLRDKEPDGSSKSDCHSNNDRTGTFGPPDRDK